MLFSVWQGTFLFLKLTHFQKILKFMNGFMKWLAEYLAIFAVLKRRVWHIKQDL